MKRILFFTLGVILLLPLWASEKVTFEQLQTEGWKRYRGHSVQITTPLIVCGVFRDSIILSPERLYVPEEHATGLAEGDSTDYFRWQAYNHSMRIRLQCKIPYSLNLGATITNLEAVVKGDHQLQTGQQPTFKNYKPSTTPPSLGKTDLVICSANLQNYFFHLGGYASKSTKPAQHSLQCHKVASALVKMKADLYTVCELEKGKSAPAELTFKMNKLTGAKSINEGKYGYLLTDTRDGDTISVGFIYNKEHIRPVGQLRFAYDPANPDTRIYAFRFMLQEFIDLATGTRFFVSLNHPRSKRGDAAEANLKRMNNIQHILHLLDSCQIAGNVILLGDYNAYSMEQPIQTLIQAGYEDVLMQHDSLGYSYSYNAECGYLDRVFASPQMASNIVSIHPVHWNTDFYYSAAFWSKYNYINNTIPTLELQKKALTTEMADFPIEKFLSKQGKQNLLFRYSDHDPILIGIKWADSKKSKK